MKLFSTLQKNKKNFTVLCVVALVVTSAFSNIFFNRVPRAEAVFNKQINYQGKLTASTSVAVADGLYNIEFKLYTVPTGGSAIWTETDTGSNKIKVTNGLFSVMLGSTTALTGIDFNQTLYLGLNIGGTGSPSYDGEMVPRKIIGAVPAAFVSDTLQGLNPTQFLRADAINSTSTATTYLTVTQSGAGHIADFLGASSASVLSLLSGGNVGIGTSSPYAKLSVAGTIVGQNFIATSSTATSTFAGGFTAGSNGLYVLQNGNIGIGTSSPTYKLDVNGTARFTNFSAFYDGLNVAENTKLTFGGTVDDGFNSILDDNAGNYGPAGGMVINANASDITFLDGEEGTPFAQFNSGKFSISPTSVFDASEDLSVVDTTGSANILIQGRGGGGGIADVLKIRTWEGISTDAYVGFGAVDDGDNSERGAIFVPNVTEDGVMEAMSFLKETGYVGVDNIAPQYSLDVSDPSNSTAGDGSIGANSLNLWDGTDGEYRGITSDNTHFYFNGYPVFGGGDGVEPVLTMNAVSGQTGDFIDANPFGSSPSFVVSANGRLGLGTTTPGTVLSLGTGANAINISTTSTSTFNKGINVTSGCYSINGTCVGTGVGTVGSGTQGQIPFYSTAGTTLTATSSLFLAQTGNVGIGTTTPSANLTVYQSAIGATSTRGIIFTGNSISANNSGSGFLFSLGYNTVGNKQIWFGDPDGAGNASYNFARIGIGGSGTIPVLDAVKGDNSVRSKLQIGVAGDTNSGVYVGTLLGVNGYAAIGTSYYNQTPPTDGLIVQGNVGIGTTSPYKTLSVSGSLALTGGLFDSTASAGTNGMILQTTGSATKWVATSTLNLISNLSNATGTLAVGNGGTGQTSFNSGDLLFGNGTSPVGSSDGFTYDGTKTLTIIGESSGDFSAYLALDDFVGGTSFIGFNSFINGLTIDASGGSAGGGNQNIILDPTAGNVGIGTVSPNAGLDVENGDTILGGQNLTVGTAGNGPVTVNFKDSGPDVGILKWDDWSADNLGFVIDGSNSLTNSFSENILLNPYGGGNVGIGNTSPQYNLDVNTPGSNIGTIGNFNGDLDIAVGNVSGYGDAYAVHINGGLNDLPQQGTIFLNEQGGSVSIGGADDDYTLSMQVPGGGGAVSIGNPTGDLRIGAGSTATNGNVIIGDNYNPLNPSTNVYITGGTAGFSQDDGSVFINGGNTNGNGNVIIGNNQSGRVGIATSTPGTFFSIGGTGNGINISTTSTSTFNKGINVTSGCYAVNGTCVGGGSGSGVVSSGTQGQLPFYNSSGTTLTATSSLFLAQSGNVGFGTTSPYRTLSVTGSSDLGTNALAGSFTATSSTATSTLNGGLSVAGTSGLTILQNGHVGINTSSPDANLQISGFNTSKYTFRNGNFVMQPYAADNAFITNNAYYNGGWTRVQSGYAVGFQFENGQFEVFNAPSGTGAFSNTLMLKTDSAGVVALGNGISSTANDYTGATLIVRSGNVGIGTTTPGTLLSLGATGSGINISATATSTFNKGINITSGCYAISGNCVGGAGGGGSGTVNSGGTGQIAFYNATGTAVSATSTLTIKNGKVGVGTADPFYALDVRTSTGDPLIYADTSNYDVMIGDQAGANNGNYIETNSSGNTYVNNSYGTSFFGDAVCNNDCVGLTIDPGNTATSYFTGALGIDVGSPVYDLDVGGSIHTYGDLLVGTTTDAVALNVGGGAYLSGTVKANVFNALSSTTAFQIGGTTYMKTVGTTGGNDFFIGNGAGNTTMTSTGNLGVGSSALASLTGGFNNTAMGTSAGSGITSGNSNVAIGINTGLQIGSGIGNLLFGGGAGEWTSGSSNIAIGLNAGQGANGATSYSSDILIGGSAGNILTTGGSNLVIGNSAGASLTTGASNILIGNSADVLASNTSNFLNIGSTLYGNTSSHTIGVATTTPWRTLGVTGTVSFAGLTTSTGSPSALCLSANNEITVNTSAQTCTVSSERFKDNITDYQGGLATVMALDPVTFSYKGTTDSRIGLIAERTVGVEPRLVFDDADGVTPRGVHYEDLAALTVSGLKDMADILQIQTTGKTVSSLRLDTIEDKVAFLEDTASGEFKNNGHLIGAGNLVQVDPSDPNVIRTAGDKVQPVIGVVSTSTGATSTVVFAGKTAVKVSLENGPISSGDYLTLSSDSGVAMKALEPGDTVGVALGNATTPGTISMLVRTGYHDSEDDATSTQQINDRSSFTDTLQSLIDGTTHWMHSTLSATTGFFKNIFADKVTTKELCLDDLCIDKDQLKALLDKENADTNTTSNGGNNSGSDGGSGTTTPPDNGGSTPPTDNPPTDTPPSDNPPTGTPPSDTNPPTDTPPSVTPPAQDSGSSSGDTGSSSGSDSGSSSSDSGASGGDSGAGGQ